MRKIVHATVLTTFNMLLGLIPLTASAQIAPDRIVICSSLSRRATFKLDGKEEALEAKQCRTYSGRSTYLFYTYYLHNPLNGGMQYRRMVPTSLKRVLSGGEQYDFQTRSSGYLDIVKKVNNRLVLKSLVLNQVRDFRWSVIVFEKVTAMRIL